VAIESCEQSSVSETKFIAETYTVSVPYQSEADVPVQSCAAVQVPVSYCINPYTKDGCVGSSTTVTQYSCSTSMQRQMVTRYTQEQRTRQVKQTFVYTTYIATIKWKRSFLGNEVDYNADLRVVLTNGKGTSLADTITDRINANLDESVSAVITKRGEQLKQDGDAALAASNLDLAESSYLQAILLGRSPGDYFERMYALSDVAIRETLVARSAGKPLHALTNVIDLPPITNEQGDLVLTILRDRFAAQFPPAMARTKGFWYAADLGTFAVPAQVIDGADAGGGFAPTFGIRLGTPLLSRLHGKTEGLAFWDDLMIGGNLGYLLTKGSNQTRSAAWRGVGTYTLAAGFRLKKFQLLAGGRAGASVMKVAETNGRTAMLALYGNVGVGIGKTPSLTLEGWWSTPTSPRARGMQLFFTVPTPQKQYKGQLKSGESGNITSYVSLRFEDEQFDGCIAATGGCINSAEIQLLTGVVSFGVSFR
jgi:hypothetical protein